MELKKINYGDLNVYYIGQCGYYNGYDDPCGIGVVSFKKDGKFIMADHFNGNVINGLGMEYNIGGRYGAFSTFRDRYFTGPTMLYGYEKYLVYEDYDLNERPQNYKIYVWYNGNYRILKESNELFLYGVLFEDGYYYFIQVDRKYNIYAKKLIKYVGNDYRFTNCQMSTDDFYFYRPLYNYVGYNNDGSKYDIGVQLLNDTDNRYHGFGAIKWGNGAFYFGEWSYGNRFGFGIYVDEYGSKHMGRFIYNKRQGSVLSMYHNGTVRMGNCKEDYEQGITFDIRKDSVIIINFNHGQEYGNKMYIYNDGKSFIEYNDSGNVTVAHF